MALEQTRRPFGAAPAAALSVGLIAMAAAFAAPAQADPTTDAFLSALNNAGIAYGNPGDTAALGRSVCPMLVEPGSSFASTASRITNGNNGISPMMSGLFTSIAIQMYCPAAVDSIANGNWWGLSQMPGLSGLTGLAGLPNF